MVKEQYADNKRCELSNAVAELFRSIANKQECSRCGSELNYVEVKYRFYLNYPTDEDIIEKVTVHYCPCCDKKPNEHGPEIDIGDRWHGL